MSSELTPDQSSSNHPPQAIPAPAAIDLNNLELLKLLLESAPIAIVMVNSTGEIQYANVKLYQMFDYSGSELQGRPIEQLIPERFRHDHRTHRTVYRANPHVRAMGIGLDLAGRRKDSSEFPIEVGLSYFPVDDDLLVMASVSDITRRKQTEDALEHRVEERTREIERRRQVSDGLRDIVTVLNSNRPLEDILNYIAAQACRLLHADASAVCRADDEAGHLSVQASFGLTEGQVNGDGPTSAEATREEPLVQTGADQVDISASGVRHVKPEPPLDPIDTNYQAVLTVPLLVKDESYGSLILYYTEPRRFSAEELELANMVGDQTALAIENARLRTQVERTAVAAERSRIARDLHDSVTQTLFSASIIAEVLPRLWQRDSLEAQRRVDELRQLTRGALAEMRTLLLELRPATLIEVDLAELLRQLTEAINGRARMPIRLEIEGDTPLPPDVNVAFYHIAQEALNNVAKHARATHATVRLERGPGFGRLTVGDNGRGFVIDKVTPEHLGLTIMRERAEAIGARLHIHSQLDHGTAVTIVWPADQAG